MREIVPFGVGAGSFPLIERLDEVCNIVAFCDNNPKLWGQYIMGDGRTCIRPEFLGSLNDPLVVIMCEQEKNMLAIEEQCDRLGIEHRRVSEFLKEVTVLPVKCQWLKKIQRKRIHKFIELLVHGTTECNFHCEYCYVWNTQDFTHEMETSLYSPEEFRRAMSLKRLGGPCHINACALGETLLSKDIVPLVYELLDEGHYVSIITNGTVANKIEQMMEFPERLQERLFLKLSFHYAELNRTGLLNRFWDNVGKIKKSQCSYSIEITPCDTLIKDIESIRFQFEQHADGAMPHITFTRNGNDIGLDLLSNLSLEEYIDTWKVFGSDLFDVKCRLYKRKICENCYAGSWSYRINVMNGNLQSCYRQDLNGTIFDNEQQILPIMPVGHNCQLEYCFNNHAFLSWGDAPEIECPTYLEVRDRVERSGVHWVKPQYFAAMSQKLYDNNFDYLDKWDDYGKLMDTNREPAFILFNSPDYTNLGDHAIAMAERELFESLFPDRAFIEVSCEQYIKENIMLQNTVKPEDVLIISGGGYLGSLWLWLEDMTKDIIQTYKNNKIIIFPQTIYFEQNSVGVSEKRSLSEICNQHNDLTILLRDRTSFKLAEEMFLPNVTKMCVPDIAMRLKFQARCERKGAMVCIREDKERKGTDSAPIYRVLESKGLKVCALSTISDRKVFLNQRQEEVTKLLQRISTAQVVVTDRLHAVIFCAVTDTPCVAMDNLSGKISQTCEWLGENKKIVFCNGMEHLEACLDRVLGEQSNQYTMPKCVTAEFEKLEKYLQETCGL